LVAVGVVMYAGDMMGYEEQCNMYVFTMACVMYLVLYKVRGF
jgi:hypothetical protein